MPWTSRDSMTDEVLPPKHHHRPANLIHGAGPLPVFPSLRVRTTLRYEASLRKRRNSNSGPIAEASLRIRAGPPTLRSDSEISEVIDHAAIIRESSRFLSSSDSERQNVRSRRGRTRPVRSIRPVELRTGRLPAGRQPSPGFSQKPSQELVFSSERGRLEAQTFALRLVLTQQSEGPEIERSVTLHPVVVRALGNAVLPEDFAQAPGALSGFTQDAKHGFVGIGAGRHQSIPRCPAVCIQALPRRMSNEAAPDDGATGRPFRKSRSRLAGLPPRSLLCFARGSRDSSSEGRASDIGVGPARRARPDPRFAVCSPGTAQGGPG